MERRSSEATAPERRKFVLLLAVVNLLFLLVDSWHGSAAAMALRVTVSAALAAAWAILGRPLAPRAAGAVVTAIGVVTSAAFAGIAFATGGSRSPYFPFLAMIPLVFGIAVPDAPAAALTVGASIAVLVIRRLATEGASAEAIGFWFIACAATTTYACTSAVFFLRQRAREARLEAERAAAEAALADRTRERARLDRLVLVGRLAAGVSQDLANPLSAARANLAAAEDRLAATAGGDPVLREALDDLRASLERMRRTVEDLRTFSRESGGTPEACPVAEVLGEAVRLLAVRLGPAAPVEADVPPGLPPVRADRRRLVQGMLWVLVEAAGALGDGAPAPGASLRVAARQEEDAVRVTVDAPVRTATAEDEGLRRLALALAREDLAKDGGVVERELAPGGAVRVVVRLPRAGARTGTERPSE